MSSSVGASGHWCTGHGVRFVYASSAATYGDGSANFDDDTSPPRWKLLRPLNLYGWTKHAYDLRVARAVAERRPHPPQWVGLKFFNVYGPNEYHKGRMISVVKVKHDEVAAGGPARLFRSTEPGLADGEQRRDFIWVGDVVDMMLWLLDTPAVNGLFNVGTGQARSYLDLAHAVCDAAGRPRKVEFIDMPESLRGQYQSFTAGLDGPPARRWLRWTVHPAGGRRAALRAGLSDTTRSIRMISVLLFPQFDPVIVQVGPFAIRWYALAYITGLVLGWRLLRDLVRLAPQVATPVQADDFLTWATLGVVLGGRLGYVLFYQPGLYLAHPAQIFAVWEGGMSFHGGMLGVAIAIWLVLPAQRNSAAWLCRPHRGLRTDRAGPWPHRQFHQWRAVGPPRAAMVAWRDDLPERRTRGATFDHYLRRTSTNCMCRPRSVAMCATLSQRTVRGDPGRARPVPGDVRPGSPRICARALRLLTGAFLVGYGIARIIGECFRQPDPFLGFMPFGTTMGQLLCIPMLFAGAWLIGRARPAR